MQICRPNEHIEVKAISVRYLEKWHERGSDLLPDKAMMECSKPSYTCRVTIIINLLVYWEKSMIKCGYIGKVAKHLTL